MAAPTVPEMVTPVLAELRGLTADYEARLVRASGRLVEDGRTRLAAAARGLPKPMDLLAFASQRLDIAVGRFTTTPNAPSAPCSQSSTTG